MITSVLMNLFLTCISFCFSFLPDSDSLPSQISDSLLVFASYFNKADSLFPVSTVFTIIALGVSVELALFFFKLINWVLNKIRGSG